jgi:hypothetical protein
MAAVSGWVGLGSIMQGCVLGAVNNKTTSHSLHTNMLIRNVPESLRRVVYLSTNSDPVAAPQRGWCRFSSRCMDTRSAPIPPLDSFPAYEKC